MLRLRLALMGTMFAALASVPGPGPDPILPGCSTDWHCEMVHGPDGGPWPALDTGQDGATDPPARVDASRPSGLRKVGQAAPILASVLARAAWLAGGLATLAAAL